MIAKSKESMSFAHAMSVYKSFTTVTDCLLCGDHTDCIVLAVRYGVTLRKVAYCIECKEAEA